MIRTVIVSIILLNCLIVPYVEAARKPMQKRKTIVFEDPPPPPPPLKKKKCKISKGGKGVPPPKRRGQSYYANHVRPPGKGVPPPPLDECTEVPSSVPSLSPSPSAAPSKSPSTSPSQSPTSEPSKTPTRAPTQHPSSKPSSIPSSKPTISHQPSISHQPTISIMPSSKPSYSFSPWCNDLAINDLSNVPVTSNIVEGTYAYEMKYQKSANLTEVLEDLDDSVLRLLVENHVWCGDNGSNRRLSESSLGHKHVMGIKLQTSRYQRGERRSLLIDGLSMDTIDIENQHKCKELTSSQETNCDVFDGTYTLYLRENSDLNHQQAMDMVLGTIRTGMDDGKLAKSVQNCNALHYSGATAGDEYRSDVPGQVTQLEQPIVSASLSSMGVLVVAAGSIITMLIVFAATRRRERYTFTRDVQFVDDDDFLFGKGIGLDDVDKETDLMSNGQVRILGDDSSDCSDIYGYGGNGRKSRRLTDKNLCERDDAMNVHHCTSATCQICAQRRRVDPVFVKSMYPDTAPSQIQPRRRRDYATPDTISL